MNSNGVSDVFPPSSLLFPPSSLTPLLDSPPALPHMLPPSYVGAWRNWIAYLLWEQGVPGSSPGAPTILNFNNS